jgi:pyruvate/2-oxoglutarate/acetoin dehydrogenase E1 component
MAVITYLEAIRQALFDEMGRDERVFVIGEDVGAYGGAFKVTEGLIDRFGEGRVIDTPISEQAIVGSAIGASYMGMRPVCEIQFIDFIACCFDMLTNFAATSRYRNGAGVPIVVRGPAGGGVGGGPFHSLNPESLFLNTPGLKMVEPSTAYDAKGLLKAAIRDDDPVLYFEHKALYRRLRAEAPESSVRTPIGRAAVARPGTDVTLIAYGAMVDVGLRAADALAGEASVEVLDLRTVWPLDDEAILGALAGTSRVCVLQEASSSLGAAGQVLSLIAREGFELLDAPPLLIAAPIAPVPFAPELEDAYIPSVDRVVEEVRKLGAY